MWLKQLHAEEYVREMCRMPRGKPERTHILRFSHFSKIHFRLCPHFYLPAKSEKYLHRRETTFFVGFREYRPTKTRWRRLEGGPSAFKMGQWLLYRSANEMKLSRLVCVITPAVACDDVEPFRHTAIFQLSRLFELNGKRAANYYAAPQIPGGTINYRRPFSKT